MGRNTCFQTLTHQTRAGAGLFELGRIFLIVAECQMDGPRPVQRRGAGDDQIRTRYVGKLSAGQRGQICQRYR